MAPCCFWTKVSAIFSAPFSNDFPTNLGSILNASVIPARILSFKSLVGSNKSSSDNLIFLVKSSILV